MAVGSFDTYAPGCRVEIEGKVLPMTAVMSVSVDENLESPAKFGITLNEGIDIKTQTFTWLDNPALDPGNKIEIYFGYANQKSTMLFKGIIKALSPSFPSSGIPSLNVEGYDLSHSMQKKMIKVHDIEVKHSDIARELATKYHLNPDGIQDSQKTYHKVARQNGEKDYTFLRKLAKKSGFECFVQSGTLYFRKPKDKKSEPPPIKTFQYRQNFISFNPRLSTAALVKTVVVSGWNKNTKESIKVKMTLQDLGSGDEIRALDKFITAAEGADPLIIEHKALQSEDEARDIAEVELKKALNQFIQGDLECIGDTTLRPGNKIEMKNLGKMFSGFYYITSARHTFGDNGYTTTLGVRRIVV